MLIDTHAHLDSPKLGDVSAVLARAREAGVLQVIAIATTAEDSARVVALAGRFDDVFASVGIHPNDSADASEEDWARVVALASAPKVVALGETGLDRYWDRVPFPVQQEWFGRHLELSLGTGLPVVIHSRDCQGDVIHALRAGGGAVRGVQHSFTGTIDEARSLLDLGLYVSFAGMVTFENRALDLIREAARFVPLDRLLVETDSPYLSPHPFRGKTNEPARVAVTAQALARVRGIDLDALAAATTENARLLFGLTAPKGLPNP